MSMLIYDIKGPYSTYMDLISGQVQRYIHFIDINAKLAMIRTQSRDSRTF